MYRCPCILYFVMQILRKYQLDLIFLFFAFIAITWTMFYGLEYLGADPHDYEWLVVGPLLVIYFVWMFKVRNSISLHERRALTTKSMIYWIALGITLFASYETPVPASDYWSINALFLMFTLLLADSYWDFKAIGLDGLFKK